MYTLVWKLKVYLLVSSLDQHSIDTGGSLVFISKNENDKSLRNVNLSQVVS